MGFTYTSSILDVQLIRLIHFFFLYHRRLTKQSFGERMIFSFDPVIFSFANNDIKTLRLLLFDWIEFRLVQALRSFVKYIF